MPKFDYGKGFILEMNLVPVIRSAGVNRHRLAIHARAQQDFTFGEFSCPAGELLCRSRDGQACTELEAPIDAVSCTVCRKLLDRWSRDAVESRCMGYAFDRDLITRAVAAKNTLLASELLGVNNNWLVRNGVERIALTAANLGDGLDPIRKALNKHPYGTVIESTRGSSMWEVVKPAQEAEQSLLVRKLGESLRGNTRVEQFRFNHTVKLTLDEKTKLKALGGSKWIRAVIAKPESISVSSDLVANPKEQITLRATDAEWEALRELGGSSWLRSAIASAQIAEEGEGEPQ